MTREEAIQRIKIWHLDDDDMKVLSVVIPELTESEDERIRKRICLCLDECVHSDIIRDYERDECLAYLEKQKEQKSAGGSSEKPNSQWSEDEDEKVWQDIFDLCNRFGYDDACRKLKSLRPQPKQEWSDEDETAYGDLIWCIEQAKKSAKDENDMGNIWFAENWVKNHIKSLRPQPHWKPSEEQMEALMPATSPNGEQYILTQERRNNNVHSKSTPYVVQDYTL